MTGLFHLRHHLRHDLRPEEVGGGHLAEVKTRSFGGGREEVIWLRSTPAAASDYVASAQMHFPPPPFHQNLAPVLRVRYPLLCRVVEPRNSPTGKTPRGEGHHDPN